MSHEEFTAFVNRNECDTVFLGWNARKNGVGRGGGISKRRVVNGRKQKVGGGSGLRVGEILEEPHTPQQMALGNQLDNNSFGEYLTTPDTPSFESPSSGSTPIFGSHTLSPLQPRPVPISLLETHPLTLSTPTSFSTETSVQTNPQYGYPNVLNPPT